MNWLAHLFLSEDNPEFRLGNVLPDITRVRPLPALSDQIMRGVACHYRIDAFTDRHPIVHRSISRIGGYRRFGGILVDIFYDHFLARSWPQFSKIPLPVFIQEIYHSWEALHAIAPRDAAEVLHRMQTADWLSCYGTVEVIETTLTRISRRLQGKINLAPATRELETNYEPLQSDFTEFFPHLQEHIGSARGAARL